MITLYFFDHDYDYDYNNHISWLQSRLRVNTIILEIVINNNDILDLQHNNNCNWNILCFTVELKKSDI